MRVGLSQVPTYRNDQITLDELIALRPTRLVISPGPGHPETDAGISKDAIRYFAGKIPILGVCMGEQAIFSAFGGSVSYAGEIVHGKVSLIKHDAKGIFKDVRQDIAVTRYHSLAGTHESLPDCLEVTSRSDSGVIMGVRHKQYTIEGVQFHPESILSEEGQLLLKNFLSFHGGAWADMQATLPNGTVSTKSGSILDRIYAQRKLDFSATSSTPGHTRRDLETMLAMHLAPPLIDFPARLTQTQLGIMAEIKRASPSKGDINPTANAAQQAQVYAQAGASVISVLTEPTWFKGSLWDLQCARAAIADTPNRPAILRKDFVCDEYQILEARVAGADTVLLIVAMLPLPQLKTLYAYSKLLGMEPLVEVNNASEMRIALDLGARVIGVNNRNLHDFRVDLGTTSRLAEMVPADVVLCALSGISKRADVVQFVSEGVRAVLVGEALMRAPNPAQFMRELDGKEPEAQQSTSVKRPIVKVCGMRSVDAALAAIDAGADLIGLIFAPGRSRTISEVTAQGIVTAARSRKKATSPPLVFSNATTWFTHHFNIISNLPKPLIVGVFRHNTLAEILHLHSILHFDLVQLHGDEPIEWAKLIPVPVIRATHMRDSRLAQTGYHHIILLDGASTTTGAVVGGEGKKIDWSSVQKISADNANIPFILAGGLDEDNVTNAIKQSGAAGVDVASGVETDGKQDIDKIKRFVRIAKGIEL